MRLGLIAILVAFGVAGCDRRVAVSGLQDDASSIQGVSSPTVQRAWRPQLSMPRRLQYPAVLAQDSATSAPYGWSAPTVYRPVLGDMWQFIRTVKIADVTGDSRNDVIAMPDEDEFHVFVQQVDGSLAEPQVMAFGSGTHSASQATVVADFNQDGVNDVATLADTQSAGAVALLLSDGHGHFTLRQATGFGDDALVRDWVVVDADQDGLPDIAAYSYPRDLSGFASLRVLFGDGHGGFSRVESRRIDSSYAEGLGNTDFNLDGLPDLAYRADYGTWNDGDGIFVLQQRADGGFEAPRLIFQTVDLQIAFGDFNSDGRTDLITDVGGWGHEVFLQALDGRFTNKVSLPGKSGGGPGAPWAVVVDFNRDRRDDVLTLQFTAPIPSLGVYLQRNGEFQRPIESPYYYELEVGLRRDSFATGDIDSDACRDVLVAASYNGLLFFKGICPTRVPGLPDESSSRQAMP